MACFSVRDVELFGGRLSLELDIEPAEDVLAQAETAEQLRLHLTHGDGPDDIVRLRRRHFRPVRDGIRAGIMLPEAMYARPIQAITILPGRPGDSVTFTDGLEQRLGRLYPRDGRDYVDMLQSHTRRWGSEKMRFFMAEQVVRFFGGYPDHRIGAALIMGYKAVEIGDPAGIAAALAAVASTQDCLPSLPADPHPRRNPQHLAISLLTVQWHLQWAQGDFAAVRATLPHLLPAADALTDFATAALSLGKSLLLAGWLAWHDGDPAQARHYWDRTITTFKSAVRDADAIRSVLFRELTHSFEAAHMAGLCLKALRPGEAGAMPTLEAVLVNALRVQPRHRARLLQIAQQGLGPAAGA